MGLAGFCGCMRPAGRMVGFLAHPFTSAQPRHNKDRLEWHGTARRSASPQQDYRHVTLTAIGHLNSKVWVSAADGAPLTNVMDMFNAMNRVGITSVVEFRLEPTASGHQAPEKNK
jgi:hypothetical protein